MSKLQTAEFTTVRVPAAAILPRVAWASRGDLDLLARYLHGIDGSVQFSVFGRRYFIALDPALIEGVFVKHGTSFAKDNVFKFLRRVLGRGILTSEGAEHAAQRRMLQPMFWPRALPAYAPTMSAMAGAASGAWRDGERIEMGHAMSSISLGIVADFLLGERPADAARTIAERLEDVMPFARRYLIEGLGRLLDRMPLPGTLRLRKNLDTVEHALQPHVACAMAGSAPDGTWIRRIVDGYAAGHGELDAGLLRDHCLTLLFAGYETTSVALTWAWYCLAQHPEAEQRLHEEVDRVLAGREPTIDDLPQLVYTRCVVKEALRLFPPGYAFGREAQSDVTIGNLSLHPGDTVFLSPYVTQRDPRYFERPGVFEPGRWNGGGAETAPRFAFFPFGGGARSCLGEGFACQEAALVLSSLARHWRFRLDPAHRLRFDVTIGLRPRGGMPMSVHARAPR